MVERGRCSSLSLVHFSELTCSLEFSRGYVEHIGLQDCFAKDTRATIGVFYGATLSLTSARESGIVSVLRRNLFASIVSHSSRARTS